MSVGWWRGSCWKVSPMFGDAIKAGRPYHPFLCSPGAVQNDGTCLSYASSALQGTSGNRKATKNHWNIPEAPPKLPNEENSSINYWWVEFWGVFFFRGLWWTFFWYDVFFTFFPDAQPPANPYTYKAIWTWSWLQFSKRAWHWNMPVQSCRCEIQSVKKFRR